MKDLEYTKTFTSEFIEDMKDYFSEVNNKNTNYLNFNNEIKEKVDFDYLKDECMKHNLKLSFLEDKNQWVIEKF